MPIWIPAMVWAFARVRVFPLEDMELCNSTRPSWQVRACWLSRRVRGEGGILLNAGGDPLYRNAMCRTVEPWLLATLFPARWRWKSTEVGCCGKKHKDHVTYWKSTINTSLERLTWKNCRASAGFHSVRSIDPIKTDSRCADYRCYDGRYSGPTTIAKLSFLRRQKLRIACKRSVCGRSALVLPAHGANRLGTNSCWIGGIVPFTTGD